MIKKLVIGISTWATISSGLLIGKSSNSNDLVFGNYSDYISPKVAQELKERYQLRVDLFDYDHLVKERFQKGIYDMAIVSTSVLSELKSSNAAMKLDWSRLLNNSDNRENNNQTDVSNNNTLSKDKELEKARNLFTDIVKDMSQDLLEYGIPYFVQKLSFYYTGDPIEGLKDGKAVSFKQVIEIVSKEERFRSNNGKPKLGLIDDPRTVLSLARKVGNKQDVNPNKDEYKNSELILNDYKELIKAGLDKNKLGENFLYMTPDSGPMVDALSGGDINGAFMYNGDGFFAANGGNNEKTMEKDKFHTVELKENIFFLDFLTFSNKMSEEKKNKAYKLAKELLFVKDSGNPFKRKGKEASSDTSEESQKESEAKNDDNEEPPYEEMAVRNFDDVWYTPTLKVIYDNLDSKYFDEDEGVGKELKKKILKVEKSKTCKLEQEYEKQLDSQQKSDMLIAYSNFKLLV